MPDMPADQDIMDSIEEVERCLWRAQESSGDQSNDHLDEADNEILSLLCGLSEDQRLSIMDRLVAHMEAQPGMDTGFIEEVFNSSSVSREDLDAYRLSKVAPPAAAQVARARI